ncbi:MAG: PAS domain-containing sensor histidine kinase [bacterium]|nr:PAS domain-containing sensor histidine kinase [bacterium]
MKNKKTKSAVASKETTEALELIKDIKDSKDIKDIKHLTVEDVVVMFAYAEAIVETVREPLVILNEDLYIKTANKAFFDMFKVKKEETYDKLIFDLGNGQWDEPALKKLLLEILPENSVFNDYEVIHSFEDIGERTMMLNARRIILEGHKTELILLAIEDVTEKRKIEKQKDDFISMVSHELKTPLTSIKMFIQLLHETHKKRKDKKSIFISNKISTQVDKLTNMMSSFLNVYAIQSGKMDMHKALFSIDKIIQDEVETFEYTTETHVISLKGKTGIKIFADKERISQVITNLLTNAIKYSPGANKIIVNVSKIASGITVSVQDFGMGIAKDQQKKIFERFYRTNGKKEKDIEGLGLGLHIASEIMKAHEGKMWVESTVGVGSTFFFSLPIHKKIKPRSR